MNCDVRLLTLALSFMLLSCTHTGPKPDSGYKNVLYTKMVTDQFSGVSSCQAIRDESYVNGLLSYNLGFDVTCGSRVVLIGSSSFEFENLSYFGIRSSRIGGLCAAAFGYSERNTALQSYWNFGDVRVTGMAILNFYQKLPSALEVRPEPSAIQSLKLIEEFLNSDHEILYVRLGEHGGSIINIDRELASKFIDECS